MDSAWKYDQDTHRWKQPVGYLSDFCRLRAHHDCEVAVLCNDKIIHRFSMRKDDVLPFDAITTGPMSDHPRQYSVEASSKDDVDVESVCFGGSPFSSMHSWRTPLTSTFICQEQRVTQTLDSKDGRMPLYFNHTVVFMSVHRVGIESVRLFVNHAVLMAAANSHHKDYCFLTLPNAPSFSRFDDATLDITGGEGVATVVVTSLNALCHNEMTCGLQFQA